MRMYMYRRTQRTHPASTLEHTHALTVAPPNSIKFETKQHRLWLQRGAGAGPTTTTIALHPPSATLRPLGLYDASADRISLLTSNPNGNNKPRLLRCRLALGFTDDDSTPLAAQALACLDAVLPPSVALHLRADAAATLDWLLKGTGGEKGGGEGQGPRLTE